MSSRLRARLLNVRSGSKIGPSRRPRGMSWFLRSRRLPSSERTTGNRQHDGLVGVTLKPWRPGLPVRQPAVVIANRHLDLRQTLFVEDLVLRDHLVHEEQVGRQRIDLIGGESPLIPERHGAMDVIPHCRRKGRAQWQYALPFPDGDILALFRLQRGRRPAPYARFAMAGDAALPLKKRCALLGGAVARRELLSRRTDRDIQGPELFCGCSASHAICRRL